MDDPGATDSHSDSDISESWTFVDNNIPKNIEIQSSVVHSSCEQNAENSESCDLEEMDTDGVAVISEDDEVSSTVPPPLLSDMDAADVFAPRNHHWDAETSSTTTIRESEEELPEDFYLTEDKNKSYVHRRNNKVSNFLNVVLLGTVVTAITLALGFMWGINDTCSLDMLNSVNKVLNNLQKLQHENDILKSKIKMLQFMRHNKPINNYPRGDYLRQFHQQRVFDTNLLNSPFDADPQYQSGNIFLMDSDGNLDLEFFDNREDDTIELNENKEEFYLEPENVSNHALKYKKYSKKPEVLTEPKSNIDSETSDKYLEGTCKVNENICHLSNKPDTLKTKEKHRTARDYKIERNKKKNYKSEQEKKKHLNSHDENLDGELNENGEWYHKMHDARRGFREKGFDDYGRNKAKWYIKKLNYRKHNEDLSKKSSKNSNQKQNTGINEDADWYNKMHSARQGFREKGFDVYDYIERQNKAKWYFKRMSDREKIRERESNKPPLGTKHQKEYFKSKE